MPAAWQFGNGNGNGVALNNGSTVGAADASVTISNAASLNSPTNPRFQILIDSELIEVDAVSGNVYSSLLRGQEGTAATTHAANATVFLPWTAGMLTGAFLRADQANTVESTGTDFKASGLAGSTAASRYIGGTAGPGGPASGTQAVGDFGPEQDGRLWVVTAAGTPGASKTTAMQELANTFTQAQTFSAGGTAAAEWTAKDFKATGVASLGSPQNTRYVGSWTTTGAPTGLTAAVADWGIDGNNAIWICTVAGTPGTWRTLPLGSLGYVQNTTTSQSGISVETDVTNITLTVTVGTGRRIRIHAESLLQSTIADDIGTLWITDNANTHLNAGQTIMRPAGTAITVKADAVLTPAGGSQTYKLRVTRGGGTGTISTTAGATTPIFMEIEDIGV